MFNNETSPYTKEIAGQFRDATMIAAAPATKIWEHLTRNDGENRGALIVARERFMSALRRQKQNFIYGRMRFA